MPDREMNLSPGAVEVLTLLKGGAGMTRADVAAGLKGGKAIRSRRASTLLPLLKRLGLVEEAYTITQEGKRVLGGTK